MLAHLPMIALAVLASVPPLPAQDDMPAPRVVKPDPMPAGATARYGSRALTHAGSVGAVAFTAGGDRIVSGGFDRTLRIWDASSGAEIVRLADALGYAIGGVTICSDARFCVASDGANAFGRFDLQEMKPVFRAFSAGDQFAHARDGSRVVSFGASVRSLFIHDATTDGKLLRTISIADGVARSAAWSPDGSMLAYGAQTKKGKAKYDGAIVVQDLAAEADAFVIPVPDHLVMAIAFSPDGARVFAGDTDGNLHVVDVAKRQVIDKKKVHDAVISALKFSPDGKTLATASNDAKLNLLDAATCQVLVSIRAHDTGIRSIDFSPDGARIVTASFDPTIGLWNSETLENVANRDGHGRPVSSVVQIDEHTLVTSSLGGDIIVWKDGKPQHRQQVLPGFVFQLAYAPSTGRLAAAGQGPFVPVWDDGGLGEMRRIEGAAVASLAVAFSRDGTRLAVSFADGTVRVYDASDLRELVRVTHASLFVNGLAWGPGDEELWTTDSSIHAWSAQDGASLRTIDAPKAPILSLKLSPDDRFVAVAVADAHVHVFDRATGAPVRAIKATEGRLKELAFSHDGTLLVTSGESEPIVRVWAFPGGALVHSIEAHEGPTLGLAFSVDGSKLFTASIDASVLEWDVAALRR